MIIKTQNNQHLIIIDNMMSIDVSMNRIIADADWAEEGYMELGEYTSETRAKEILNNLYVAYRDDVKAFDFSILSMTFIKNKI